MNQIRKTLAAFAAAALCCATGAAHATTYDFSYVFATGDEVQGTVDGTLNGTVISGISAIDLAFNGVDFGSSLTTMTWDAASASYVDGLTLSTVAAANNFIIVDPTGTFSFSFSVSPDSGNTQVAATNLDSLDHSAAVEDAVQASWAVTPAVAPVPEPATSALLLAGLGVVGAVARRRQRAA
jgi:PEP-CTERM motif